MNPRIVIFAKAPVAGTVKTRLIPLLGAEGAARVAKAMLDDTFEQASRVEAAEVELCCAPEPDDPAWAGHLPPARLVTAQDGGDLGERMGRAVARVTAEGAPAILVGTDCPALDAARLAAACDALQRHDAVIHPAEDGGYVLLGLRRHHRSIFAGIGWSGPDVARDTIARLRALDWSILVAETLSDIDDPDALMNSRYAALATTR